MKKTGLGKSNSSKELDQPLRDAFRIRHYIIALGLRSRIKWFISTT